MLKNRLVRFLSIAGLSFAALLIPGARLAMTQETKKPGPSGPVKVDKDMAAQMEAAAPKERSALSPALLKLIDGTPEDYREFVSVRVTIATKEGKAAACAEALGKLVGVADIKPLPAGLAARVRLSYLQKIAENPMVVWVDFPTPAVPMKPIQPKASETPAPQSLRVIGPADLRPIQSLYRELNTNQEPAYLTADFVIACVQSVLADVQLDLEGRLLAPEMRAWLGAALDAARESEARSGSELQKRASDDFMALLAVPLALVDKEPPKDLPPGVEKAVKGEVELVTKAAGRRASPVLGTSEDYTQYRVRGLYEGRPELQSYFRAALWLSRAAWVLRPDETIQADEACVLRHYAAASVAREVLAGPKVVDAGKRLFESRAYLFGPADDKTPADPALEDLLAGEADFSSPDTLKTRFSDVEKALAEVCVSQVRGAGGGEPLPTLRLLPASLTWDSMVFSLLTYNSVGRYTGPSDALPLSYGMVEGFGPTRVLPRPQDLLGFLGYSGPLPGYPKADRLYENFETRHDAAEKRIKASLAPGWRRSLDGRWFSVLKAIAAPGTVEDANRALAAWTLNRHRGLIGIKQSYTAAGKGFLMEPPKLRLEPAVEIYRELQALVEDLNAHCVKWNSEVAGKYNLGGIGKALSGCVAVAQAGGEGEDLRSIFDTLLGIKDSPAAVVADVHTDVNQGVAYAVGTSHPVTVRTEDTLLGYRFGDVLELRVPMDKRPSDSEWEQTLRNGPLPKPVLADSNKSPGESGR